MENNLTRIILIISLISFFFSLTVSSQQVKDVSFSRISGLTAEKFILSDSSALSLFKKRPLFSFLLNDIPFRTNESEADLNDRLFTQVFDKKVLVKINPSVVAVKGWKSEIEFENIGTDTISVSNVVPFGTDDASVDVQRQIFVRS